MRLPPRWFAVGAAVLAFAGCSSDDNPVDPGPDETAPPTIDRFTVTGSLPLDHGESTKLLWKAPNAASAVITPGIGNVAPAQDGTFTIRPTETTTYTLTVSNSAGTAEAQFTVDVRYAPGLYVNSTSGDDDDLGTSPQTALRTLGEALTRLGGGGAIYLTGSPNPSIGTYPEALVFDSQDVSIFGGLNPETFFPDPVNSITIIKPASGVPLTVRNTTTKLQFFDLRFDASNGGSEAVRIENASAAFETCMFDGRNSAAGAAIVLEGSGRVDVNASRVYGGRDRLYLETAGVRASTAGELQITNCFIDGGLALEHSSGIEARGIVRAGFNTIVSQVSSPGFDQYSAGIRIVNGHPAIGGNIFVGQGAGQRLGVAETQAGSTNPSWFEGNLFVGVTIPPYLNADGESPTSEKELNQWEHTNGNASTVGGNYWPDEVAASTLFLSLPNRDYHLVHPLPNGDPNPAVDHGDVYLKKPEYGAVTRDFDGARRPTTAAKLDLGADEH